MNKHLITVKRKFLTKEATIGELDFYDFHCFTLEDTVRPNGEKVYGKTAIPAGEYNIVLSYSNRFAKFLPHLLNVPNFEGVLIHPGNKAEDTEGCLLVGSGYDLSTMTILESRKAFTVLAQMVKQKALDGKIFISIT